MEEENRKKTIRNKAEISQTEKVSNCTKSVFVEHRSTMGDKKTAFHFCHQILRAISPFAGHQRRNQ
jgi:hypothetical protein